jgi:hypothetical protein
MQTELLKAIAATPIVHPTKIASITMTSEAVPETTYVKTNLCVSLIGHDWWKGGPAGRSDVSYEFVFEDVIDGSIDPTVMSDPFEEHLENFDVQLLANVGWAQPSRYEIFCSSAVLDPISLYMALQDFLVQENSQKTPEDFLNWQATLRQFASLVASNSYLIARCPEIVRRVISDELTRQGVRHNCMQGHAVATDIDSSAALLVRLGGSSFLCRAAYGVFPD